MKALRVLITENKDFDKETSELLHRFFEVRSADLDRQRLIYEVRDTDILWVRLRHHIDAEIIENAPKLRIIVSPTTGLNHIDLNKAEERKIKVISLQGESDFLKQVYATAEHTVGLILALLRNSFFAFNHVLSGGWDRDQFKGRELAGKTVGIVGYGRLGRIVAQYLRAFQCRILASDPYLNQADADVRLVSLQELLIQSDIVTLHVNLTPQTEKFFGASEFACMKYGSWFVNTSRGELIDETALLKYLASGWLAGAAVDVLTEENAGGMSHHPLVVYARTHHHLIISPHIGGCTYESMGKTERFMAEKLIRYVYDTK